MPFQPGKSGNPTGRRKESPFRDALMLALKRADEGQPDRLHRIAEKHVALALGGDVAALRDIADRLDGKPAQSIIGDEESPLEIVHRIERIIVDPGR